MTAPTEDAGPTTVWTSRLPVVTLTRFQRRSVGKRYTIPSARSFFATEKLRAIAEVITVGNIDRYKGCYDCDPLAEGPVFAMLKHITGVAPCLQRVPDQFKEEQGGHS